ncbi:hypothetical protein Tco_0313598 [Tanacetum coccineum]
MQQEKLKEEKDRLNFEGCSGRNSRIQEVSQPSVSRTPNVTEGDDGPAAPTGKDKRDRGVLAGGKEKSVFAHSESRYQSSRSRKTKPPSESEDNGEGHWKSRSKKQKSSIEEDDMS